MNTVIEPSSLPEEASRQLDHHEASQFIQGADRNLFQIAQRPNQLEHREAAFEIGVQARKNGLSLEQALAGRLQIERRAIAAGYEYGIRREDEPKRMKLTDWFAKHFGREEDGWKNPRLPLTAQLS